MNQIQKRYAATEAKPLGMDDRRVTLSVSSTAPVQRGFEFEVLEHSAAAVDLDWLASGRAPLLLDHDPRKQIGVIEKVSLDERNGVLRATVRFGQGAPEAEGVLRDIQDGIRHNVSIGYVIQRVEQRGDQSIATRWKPIEVSIVSIPADQSVGVGRSMADGATQKKEHVAMSEQPTKLTAREAAEIIDLGHRHGFVTEAHQAIESGMPIVDFRQQVLRNLGKGTTTIKPMQRSASPEPFHLGKFLRGKLTGDWSDARNEREIATDLTRSARGVRGSVVPVEALATRAAMMTTGVAAPLQAIDHRGDLFIEALRPASFAIQAGVQMVAGLTSDVSIPRETTAPAASWVAEGGTIAEANPAFDNVTLGATMLAARVSMTRKALLQGIPAMDDMLKRSINRQFASALDAAVIAGSGVAPIPRGIEASVGINSFATALAGAVTWDEIIAAWQAIATDDVPPDPTMAWVMHPTIAGILRGTEKFAGSSGEPILGDVTEIRDGSVLAGRIMGRPAFETSHATASKLTLGRMSDVMIGQFGGVDFVIDEYTGASKGEVSIYAYAFFDVAVRHPQSFCVITGI
jgi:HK97 family phage major capsid protein/HK97 family phage prohead protease